MPTPTRKTFRGDYAYRAILAYSSYAGLPVDASEENIVSFLADLMTDRQRPEYGYDFDRLLAIARELHADDASERELEGVEGQDRDSYTDTQDRDSYTVTEAR